MIGKPLKGVKKSWKDRTGLFKLTYAIHIQISFRTLLAFIANLILILMTNVNPMDLVSTHCGQLYPYSNHVNLNHDHDSLTMTTTVWPLTRHLQMGGGGGDGVLTCWLTGLNLESP